MLSSLSIGSAIARVFLFPGDLACAYIGIDQNDKRELVRMLVCAHRVIATTYSN